MIISTTDRSPLLEKDEVWRVLCEQYGESSLRLTTRPEGASIGSEYIVYIKPPAESSFSYSSLKIGSASLDGLPDQNMRVAVAIRAAMPRDAARTVLLDVDAYQYVDLTWGISVDEIKSRWRSIDEGGFENL